MLAIAALGGGYGRMTVFEGVDLTVEAGRCTAVLGPNGAGKTTLLNTVVGLQRSRGGTVHLDGDDVTSSGAWRVARKGMVLVPEGRHLFDTMTIEENLDIARENAGSAGPTWSRQDIYELFPRLQERTGVEARRLSGGEQQMVAIARALMMGPSILALDEPSTGLSPQMVRTVMNVVRQLADRGMGILLVEQNAQEVVRIADEMHVLDHGRITWSGPPSALEENSELRAAYLGLA